MVWPDGASTCAMIPDMASVDASNANNSAFYGLEVSMDNQETWLMLASYVWAGGTQPPAFGGGPSYPSLSAGFGGIASPPTHARAVIVPNQPLDIGVQLEFS